MKQTIRLTESELRGMISEAVNEAVAYRTKRINESKRSNAIKLTERQLREMIDVAVNEALTQSAYANLAGQANGATSTLGGKIKGLFNPKWKERKQRQEKEFAKAATHYSDPHISDEDGYEYAINNKERIITQTIIIITIIKGKVLMLDVCNMIQTLLPIN